MMENFKLKVFRVVADSREWLMIRSERSWSSAIYRAHH
jgi:hypothetical protein